MIEDFVLQYKVYRNTGDKAIRQVADSDLNKIMGVDNNSIAVIVRHISGNFLSRFTDFLTSDGEKPWRDRDAEFEERDYDRKEVEGIWQRGWDLLESELAKLTDDNLRDEVTIRGTVWTVHDALCRSLAHVAYHVGQIVLLARILTEGNWQWITIPKGKSVEYNRNPDKERSSR